MWLSSLQGGPQGILYMTKKHWRSQKTRSDYSQEKNPPEKCPPPKKIIWTSFSNFCWVPDSSHRKAGKTCSIWPERHWRLQSHALITGGMLWSCEWRMRRRDTNGNWRDPQEAYQPHRNYPQRHGFGVWGLWHEVLEFSQCDLFGGVFGNDVKWFLLCRYAPLNLSECCQMVNLTWFGTHSEAIVELKNVILGSSLPESTKSKTKDNLWDFV